MTSPDIPTAEQPPPPPRRLTRSASDRQLAGVAGGIARHFDLDPSLVRIAFVVLALFGGLGLAIYAVSALVVPSDPGAEPLSTSAKWGLAAVGIAGLIAFPFAGFFVAPGIGVLVVLGALAVVVWRGVGGRPNSRLLRGSIVVLAVIGSVMLGLGAGIAAAFGGGTGVAVAALVVGAGLVVGGFLGGARWLIFPALLLVLPASVVSAADLDLEGGVGDREYRPASVSELRSEYRLGVGEMVVDLRALRLEPGQDVDVTVRMGIGRAQVIVPEDVCVSADGHAGVGLIDLLGQTDEGVDVDSERGGSSVTRPTINVDVRGGVGDFIVGRAPVDHHGRGPLFPTGCP